MFPIVDIKVPSIYLRFRYLIQKYRVSIYVSDTRYISIEYRSWLPILCKKTTSNIQIISNIQILFKNIHLSFKFWKIWKIPNIRKRLKKWKISKIFKIFYFLKFWKFFIFLESFEFWKFWKNGKFWRF